MRKAALRLENDGGFGVRAALACQPGDTAAVHADALLQHCLPGQVVADTTAHAYSRDRGFEFDRSAPDYSVLRADSTDFAVPRALRSAGAFVGRSLALDQLGEAWDRACDGELIVAEVTGEPGLGKTRLVSEFAHRVAVQGAAVLFGSCDPELDIPYGPLADALGQAAEADADFAGIIESDDGAHGSVLQASAPTADGSLPPDHLATATAEADREFVFERFAQVIGALAERRPVVLVIEDLHWANASTLLVLRHIVSSVSAARLMVVGAYRPTEVGRGHPLLDLHAEFLRLGTQQRTVELAPLDIAEVTELVQEQLQGTADPSAIELIERVHRETSGSPS